MNRRHFITASTWLLCGNLITVCRKSPGRKQHSEPAEIRSEQPDSSSAVTDSRQRYREAPMLAEKVARGEMLSVEQRLPKIPYIRHVEYMGQYGQDVNHRSEATSLDWC
jgi:hypothetical protein